MNCQEYREMIEDALDISIHGELEAHVRRHLEHCAECRDYFAARQAEHVALFTAVNAAYAHLRPPPSDFVDRLAREVKARRATRRGWRRFSPPRWTLIAASLVLVVGFVFAASYMVERLASASYAADSRRDLPIQCDDSRTTAMAEINETVNLPVSDVAVDCSVDERYSGRTFTPTTEGTKNMNMKNAAGVVIVAALATGVSPQKAGAMMMDQSTGAKKDTPVTQYLWWETATAPVWKNADGDIVTWTNGNDAVWKSVWTKNTSLGSTVFDMNSLMFDAADYRSNFWLDGGFYRIGAGGLTFNKCGFFPVGRSLATDRRITLTASQDWRGTQVGTSRSDVSIGYFGFIWESTAYYHMRLEVENAVEWWKISGLLNVWIGGQNDQLGAVDVTVESPAKLMLVKQFRVYSTGNMFYPDAMLSAKKLILKGDGFQLPTDAVNYPYSNTYDEMCINTLDVAHIAPVLELVDGADLSLSGGLFAIPSVSVKGIGTSEMIGSFSNNLALTSITFSDEATLRLNAIITDGAAGPSAISATGAGTLKINTAKYAATGMVSLGAETTLCLEGRGSLSFPFSGGAVIELDIGEGCTNYLNASELAAYIGRELKVKSGTLLLQSRDSLPDGVNVIEDGGEVAYAVDNPLIVTDAVRTETAITVSENETLLVFGNGLTSATSLTLAGGSIRFMRSAIVASPVSVLAGRGPARIYTDAENVYGTISGAVSAASDVQFWGTGWIELSGGATFYGTASLRAYEGYGKISNGDYAFGTGELFVGTSVSAPVGDAWRGDWCRKFVVGNGANVTFAAHSGNASFKYIRVNPLPDGLNYKREAVLEIAEGGTVTLPNTSDIVLGNNQNIGTLHINGGTLRMSEFGRIRLGDGPYSTGYIIIDSGTLRLGGYIYRTYATGMGYVIWNGGTVEVDQKWRESDAVLINAGGDLSNASTMRVSVNVAGDDCVLDLAGCSFSSISNTCAIFNGMFNEWWGRGRLTVRGGKNFVMTSMPDGFRLRLEGNGTSVTFPSDGKVYDCNTCLENCQWRKPYGATADYNVTNSWLSVLSFANVTFAGTNCSFVCERDATPIFTTNVTVASTGMTGVAEALPASAVLGDLMFENGAIWSLGELALDVPGVLTFGNDLRLYTARLPLFTGRRAVAWVSGGVVGSPSVSIVGNRRNLRFITDSTSVFISQMGTVVLFR